MFRYSAGKETRFFWLLILVSVCCALDFIIKPDLPSSVSETKDGVTCTFTYAASGGTSEDWILELEKTRGSYFCTVGRPNPPSYLFFYSYEVKIKGGTIQDIDVNDNSGPLRENRDFVVDEAGYYARNHPDFKGTINLIEVEIK